MAILGNLPGGGYWTGDPCALYAKATNGSYLAALLRPASQTLPTKFSRTTVYGSIATTVVFDEKSPALAKQRDLDVPLILLSRNLHDLDEHAWRARKSDDARFLRGAQAGRHTRNRAAPRRPASHEAGARAMAICRPRRCREARGGCRVQTGGHVRDQRKSQKTRRIIPSACGPKPLHDAVLRAVNLRIRSSITPNMTPSAKAIA